MEDTITQAKAEFLRAQERIAHALATTPDDRLHWSPSPTARTPIQNLGHAASMTAMLQGMLTGEPFPFAGIAEADAAARASEKQFTSREQVLEVLEQTSREYVAWLDTLTPEQLAAVVTTPFAAVPLATGITWSAFHMHGHAAQIDYIQTIYGDHDWHIPT